MERPKLRPVEPLPVEVEGRTLVALNDPDRYCDETALLDPGALGLVALLDGTRTVPELYAWLEQNGAEVTLDGLQSLVDSLDGCLLLENARFLSAKRQREEAFAAAPVRRAAHAGSAYPGEPQAARSFLQGIVDHADRTESAPFRRLIAPHIDLELGAPIHASAVRAIEAAGRPDLVVVLGVCHALCDHRFIACRKDFETPFGRVPHDGEFLDALEERFGRPLTNGQIAHQTEHSVEFQALWLAHLWPEDPPTIVPFLVGSFHDLIASATSPSSEPDVESFVGALRRTLDAEARRCLVVASVDLAHMGPRYGDPAGLDADGESALERADTALLEPVLKGDAEGFFRAVAADGNARNICGVAPIYVTLRLGEGAGRLLRYGQGRIDPETGSVVSYVAASFDS